MSLKPLDLKELKAIVDWVGVSEDVREFSLKYGDVELFVSRNQQASADAFHPQLPLVTAPSQSSAAATPAAPVSSPAAASAPNLAPAAQVSEAASVKPSAGVKLAANEMLIKAPMVGTYYASPTPGAPAFISVGDKVKPDTVLCIVEVMKLMNNIEAGVEGVVTQILVDNESAVEYGQPMVVIERGA